MGIAKFSVTSSDFSALQNTAIGTGVGALAGAGLGMWNANQQYKNALAEAQQLGIDPRSINKSDFTKKNLIMGALGGATVGGIGGNIASKGSKLNNIVTQRENKNLQQIGESELLKMSMNHQVDEKARAAANKALAELGRDGQKNFKGTLMSVGMPLVTGIPAIGMMIANMRKKGMSEAQIEKAIAEHKRLHPEDNLQEVQQGNQQYGF